MGVVRRQMVNAQFLYSITIYMLHYNPHSMPVESGLQSALNRHTVRPFTGSDDTRCCSDTIFPPEDEQGNARNMSRIIM